MMKGKTTIIITPATAIAAFQMYFDAVLKESHTITDVKAEEKSSVYGGSPGFQIDLCDATEKKP